MQYFLLTGLVFLRYRNKDYNPCETRIPRDARLLHRSEIGKTVRFGGQSRRLESAKSHDRQQDRMKTTTKPKNTLRLAGAWLCSKATTACIGAASLLLLSNSSAPGADVTWTFDTDPTLLTEPHPIKVYQGQDLAFRDSTSNSVYWKPAGGNPGGFLGVTWPIGSSSSIVLFPDIDTNGVVTSFHMDMDMRVGNPQQNVRAADGFSINFARINAPVFVNHDPNDFATPGAVETGTTTGLSVIFDTWAGNQLPGGEADIEGIIVRVDNVTVLKQAMPTRNGSCTDVTSIQTGNRNEAYWTAVKANGFN